MNPTSNLTRDQIFAWVAEDPSEFRQAIAGAALESLKVRAASEPVRAAAHAAVVSQPDVAGPDHPSDNGLRLALLLASDDLAEIRDYFAERCDAERDEDGYTCNAEMHLLNAVDRIVYLHERLAKGSAPTQRGYQSGGAA